MCSLKTKLIVAGILMSTGLALRGEMASGTYTLTAPTNVYIWDASGTYSESVDLVSVPNMTIVMDPAGKITGSGSGSVENMEIDGYYASMDLTFTINGAVRSSGDTVRGSITMKLNGSGTVAGYNCTMSGTVIQTLELDAVNRELVGTIKGSVSVAVPSLHRHGRSTLYPHDVSISLSPDAGGQWDLNLMVNTNKTKYTGTGSMVLSTSTTLPMTVTGSYAAKTDLSKFTLKGQDFAKAVSLSVSGICSNDVVLIKSLKGKAFGQTIKYSDQ